MIITWSLHGPEMKIDTLKTCLRPSKLSPNMVGTWPKHGPNMVLPESKIAQNDQKTLL